MSLVKRDESITEYTFDRNGVINYRSHLYGTTTFKIEYHSESPIKFDFIIAKYVNPYGQHQYSHKITFAYDDLGVPQKILVYRMSFSSGDFKQEEALGISYYEKGVMIGDDFYSFFDTYPSIPYEYYSNGVLWTKRFIKNNGDQLIIGNKEIARFSYNDTAVIFNKNNDILFHSETHFYPEYHIERKSNIKDIYTKFDRFGNWIKSEAYSVKRGDRILIYTNDREIIYY